MKRLTERNKNGLAMAACCGKACEYNYVCEVGGFGECRGMDDIIDRLADIEDILGDDYDLGHLRELVETDRAGLVKVLPCKVGDTVYTNVAIRGDRYKKADRPYPVKVVFIGIGEHSAYFNVAYDNGRCFPFDFDQIGKTVFLTREAAEAMLEKESHEDSN